MKIFNVKKVDGVSFSLVGKKELYRFFMRFFLKNGFSRKVFVDSFEFSTRQFDFYFSSNYIETVRFFDDEPCFCNEHEVVRSNGLFQVRSEKGFLIDYDSFSKNILLRISKTNKVKKRKRYKVDCSTSSYRRGGRKKYKSCRAESKREHGDFITSMEFGVKIRRKQFTNVSVVKRYCMEDFTWKRKEERNWKAQRKGRQWQKNN